MSGLCRGVAGETRQGLLSLAALLGEKALSVLSSSGPRRPRLQLDGHGRRVRLASHIL